MVVPNNVINVSFAIEREEDEQQDEQDKEEAEQGDKTEKQQPRRSTRQTNKLVGLDEGVHHDEGQDEGQDEEHDEEQDEATKPSTKGSKRTGHNKKSKKSKVRRISPDWVPSIGDIVQWKGRNGGHYIRDIMCKSIHDIDYVCRNNIVW